MNFKKGLTLVMLLWCISVFGIPDSLLVQLHDTIDIKNPIHLKLVARDFISNREFEKSRIFLEEAIDKARRKNMVNELAYINYFLADYYYYTNQYKQSMSVYTEILPVFETIGDTLIIARTLNSIGLIHKFNNQEDKAFECYLSGVEMLNRMSEPSLLELSEKVAISVNIINLYNSAGQYEQALPLAKSTLESAQVLNDSMRIGNIYNTIGNININLNDFKAARTYYDKALNVFSSLHDHFKVAFILNNLGNLANTIGDYDSAHVYYSKSVQCFEKEGYTNGIGLGLLGIASTYMCLNKYDEAIARLFETVEFCANNEEFTTLSLTYYDLSSTYSEMSDFENAFKYRTFYHHLKDSLDNDEKAKQYTELQAKYETIEKENQINELKTEKLLRDSELRKNKIYKWLGFSIALVGLVIIYVIFMGYVQKKKANEILHEKNCQIEFQNERLKTLNTEVTKIVGELEKSKEELTEANGAKDKFFSILAHDLRNPFHNILGQSFLLSTTYTSLDATERIRYAREINSSCTQVHRLLENLLEWSRTQSKKIQFNPQRINISSIADNAIAVLAANAKEKNISIKTTYGQELISNADGAMIDTVFRNIINNSIKFTNEGGSIIVSITVSGNNVLSCVEDNGVGIGLHNLKNIFQIDSKYKTVGTNREKGTGLGLVIVKEFIDFHNGDIWAESIVGQGSKFYFSIPVNHS